MSSFPSLKGGRFILCMTSKMTFMASWFTVPEPVVRQNITVEVWMSKAARVWNKTGSSSDQSHQ